MTPEQQAVEQWLSKPAPFPVACGCMGPRNGEPVCPCAMKWVEKVDGQWYQITDCRHPAGIVPLTRALTALRDTK